MRVGLVVGPLTPAIEVALAKGPKVVPPGEEDDDVYLYSLEDQAELAQKIDKQKPMVTESVASKYECLIQPKLL